MKVAVYAISQNEARFVSQWVRSMGEADEIYVLDTGSDDGTPELLKGLGVHITRQTINPWRFDTARNQALELIPEDVDICVCTNLDECFRPGWRTILERAWFPWVQQAYFRYTWSFTPEGEEAVVVQRDTIHSRHSFRWTNPIREVLTYSGPGDPAVIFLPQVQLMRLPVPGAFSDT